MPLIVENPGRNPVVFAKGSVVLTWAPSGDRAGNDVLMAPDALAEDMDFLNSVRRGDLRVLQVSDPALQEKMDSLMQFTQRVHRDPAEADAKVEAVLDRRQERDIVGRPCVGPDARGNDGRCGTQVLSKAALTGDEPPLCSQHQGLINQFYFVPSGSVGEGADGDREGVVTKVWKRAEMTPARQG